MSHDEGGEGIDEYQQELTVDVNTNNSEEAINNIIDLVSTPSIDVDITDSMEDVIIVDNDVEALFSHPGHDHESNYEYLWNYK
jgi:hypothetical protein